jgi:hypothetical protein
MLNVYENIFVWLIETDTCHFTSNEKRMGSEFVKGNRGIKYFNNCYLETILNI